MPTISTLTVDLVIAAENFNNGIKAAQKEAKELEKTLKPTIQAAEDLGKAFTVAGIAVTAAFAGMVKSSADYGEQLNKANIQTGIATEKLSALKYIAEQEETSFETLSKGLKAMATNANNGADAFSQLGVRTVDAHGKLRPMDDILLDVSKRMSSLEDGTTKNTLASAIFGGKLGQELIPTLNRLGREGLAPATDIVQKLGLEMSGNAAHASDDFNDSIKEVEDSLLGLSNAVTAALLPGLSSTTGSLRDGIVAVKDFAKEHDGLTKVIAIAAAGLTGAGGFLLGLAGIVAIYPKVVVGLDAIAGGLTLTTAAATAGAAAIIYWATQVISTQDDIKRTFESSAEMSHAAIMKQWDMLVKIGIVVDHGKLSWDEFGAAVGRAFVGNLEKITEFNNAHKTITDSIHILTKEEEKAIEVEKKWRQVQADLYREAVDKAAKFVAAWLDGFAKTSEAADKFTESLERQQVATSKLAYTSADAAVVIATAMVSAHDAWDDANDKTMGSNAKLFNELNGLRETDLDKQVEYLTKRVKTEEQMLNRSIAAYERMGDEFARTFERSTEAASYSVAGMVVHMKFNMDQLKSIAQDTAQSMLGSFIKGLISPLTNELTKLGTKLGDVISGALGIGSKGGGIGLPGIGGVGGGGTGNILGKGAGSIGMFGLSGAATLGIGAAALAVGLIAKHYIGKGRRTADEFTSGVQNQFGSDLAEVSAHGTVADLDTLWAQFNKDANQFASQGGTEQKVVDQAHQTLDALVAQVRRDVAARDASNAVNITVNAAPNMDINNLLSEMIRLVQTDAVFRNALQGALA